MTYEEKEKLIDAATVLKEHCKENCNIIGACDCIFIGKYNKCLAHGFPKEYEIPTLSRWTPEEILRAKALKTLGAASICRDIYGALHWFPEKSSGYFEQYEIPSNAFDRLLINERVILDDIIREAENGEQL